MKKIDIKSSVQPFFSWIAVVVFMFALLPFSGQAQTKRPVVPVVVKKNATPVSNPGTLDNPNAWDITLRVETGDAKPENVDIVLVMDRSGSMRDKNRLKYAKEAAEYFIGKMLPDGTNTENVRVALVTFSDDAHVESDFTKDADKLKKKIRKITARGATYTQAGVHKARELLKKSSAPQKHIVFLADGEANIQYELVGENPYHFVPPGGGDPLVDLIPSWGWGSDYRDYYYARGDLQESDYNYGKKVETDTGDPTPTKRWFSDHYHKYYIFPCNAAVNEAKFAKDKGIVFHSIGLDTGHNTVASETLRLMATTRDHYHFAYPVDLIDVFNDIAQTIRTGLTNGKVQDVMAPGFIIDKIGDYGGIVTDKVEVSQGTVSYNSSSKTFSWDLGGMGKSDFATLTYRVFANVEDIQNDKGHINPFPGSVPDDGGFDTNLSASINYTNSNDEHNQKQDFPRPAVKLGYGYIKRHYVLVNEQGKPITLDGSVVGSLSNAEVLQTEDFFLPAGVGNIASKWIKMDKNIDDPSNQKFPVTPSKKIIEYKGETYQLVDGSESGSTPDGGKVGISWKKPIGHAYFAYVRVKNYWMGGTSGSENAWNVSSNWTNKKVPSAGEDVEFATVANNNGKPAKADLHLDDMPQNGTKGRVIGNLINASDKDLVITQNNQLTIKGKVTDGNPSAGTIVVKSGRNQPTGTLKFEKPGDNPNVDAVVEFYSKAYDCKTCGMYRRSWQYFGIPVQQVATFPSSDVPGDETINQWVEPFNGDKWKRAPYTPDTELKKFKGYEITNSSTSEPTGVYKMKGQLNVGDADVPLTRTSGVNYMGANLVGNSYTAAIDIKNAINFPSDVKRTVYLFNTGTRDQWRKLNGSTVQGYQGGQYLAVPVNTAGSGNLPDRIPSMQTFLVLQESGNSSTLKIIYDKLIKNTTVNDGDGHQIVLRSAEDGSGASTAGSMPTLAMDVLGCGYADRVLFFANERTTDGYDDGWDGYKIPEPGRVQLYAMNGETEERFAVSTVPAWTSLTIGFDAPVTGEYVAEFAIGGLPSDAELELMDLTGGSRVRIKNGSSYTFTAKRGDTGARFRLSYDGTYQSAADPSSPIEVRASGRGRMTISNGSDQTCRVSVSDLSGKQIRREEVSARQKIVLSDLSSGMYVVRLQGAGGMGQVKKVKIKD